MQDLQNDPNLGKYMNLHLEIGTAPMHFLAMDTIEIRDADSAYKYTFTLIAMLTNYVFVIPVKDICGKILVHEYICHGWAIGTYFLLDSSVRHVKSEKERLVILINFIIFLMKTINLKI